MENFKPKPKENKPENDSIVAGALIAATSYDDQSHMEAMGANFIGPNPKLEGLRKAKEKKRKELDRRTAEISKNTLREFSKEAKRLLSNGSSDLLSLRMNDYMKVVNKELLIKSIEDNALGEFSDFIDRLLAGKAIKRAAQAIDELIELGVSRDKLAPIEEKVRSVQE
ncbi:hypothetical protein K2P96_02155 [Patescibacteria group bacterium]|nr:hypothetical protein [Patescibacteria group bacterium]